MKYKEVIKEDEKYLQYGEIRRSNEEKEIIKIQSGKYYKEC